MCGVDRVVFGSDYGPIPYRIEEHVQIVEDVLPSPAERQLVLWKTSNRVFRLGLSDTVWLQRLETSLARQLFTDLGSGLERDPIPTVHKRKVHVEN